ncbi:MAG: 23S rRNA (guanosine(2251)-2'-O)-methyltransferase RlmB [Acidimicrobiia bacterium]
MTKSSGRAKRRAPGTREQANRASSGREGLGGSHVEGRRAVRELLRARRRRIRRLVVSTDLDADPVIDEIVALAADARVRIEYVSGPELDELARSSAPQGVIAQATPVAEADVDRLLARPAAFVVALDGVTDPGNLGAVIRTAETAGATAVVLPRHRAAGLSPAAVKAASGAIEHVPIALVAGIPAFLDRATRAGLWTVGLDERGTTSVFDLTVGEGPVVLVLGAEGRGLSRLVLERCEVVAAIPMRGALESLNVSAAAAIACFEITRRRTP